MIDTTSDRGRIIKAAMTLAARDRWAEVSLSDIAAEAGTDLAKLRADFSSKADIVSAFVRLIDDEILKTAPAREPNSSARDAVFEILMNRFDALEPYRAALKSISKDQGADLDLYRAILNSQAWMLRAAGVDAEGISGGVRAAGLASVYASVFQTWLDDDDAGLARTMAVLDRRLRRGESTLKTLDGIAAVGKRIVSIFMPGPSRETATPPPEDQPVQTPGQAPSPGNG